MFGGPKANIIDNPDGILVSIGSNYQGKKIVESQFIYTTKKYMDIEKAIAIFVATAKERNLDGVVNITFKIESDFFYVFADLVKFE